MTLLCVSGDPFMLTATLRPGAARFNYITCRLFLANRRFPPHSLMPEQRHPLPRFCPLLILVATQFCSPVHRTDWFITRVAPRTKPAIACEIHTFCVMSTRRMRLNFSFTAQFVVVRSMHV
jgi:hypothetical protein